MLGFLKKFRKPVPAGAAVVPLWIEIAMKELGVHEVRGGENPRIIEYHSATSLHAQEDEVAWCSAFVNWVMMKSGMERTHSAAARSWLGYGPNLGRFTKYAIVIFKRGNSTWQGHVAFCIDDLGDNIRVLGGNQSDAVTFATFKKRDVLAYVWPHQSAAINPPA